MYLKQSKNTLEEINFDANSRSSKKIMGFVYKKYDAIHWYVQHDFFNYLNNGHAEPRFI